MRDAFLYNKSQSIVSIPLYDKVPVEFRGRTVQKVQFKKLVPGEQFKVGTDLNVTQKKYYSQFKSIMVELIFKDSVKATEPEVSEPPKEDENTNVGDAQEASVEVEYTEEILMKKRQSELIEIATGLGIEATTQESKAEISKKILESLNIG